MPSFWGYPLQPHEYPYIWSVHTGSQAHTIHQFILDPKSKQDKVKVTNWKNLPKLQFFLFCKKKTLHTTHLLKLLDKVCKYEMDPATIVEDTIMSTDRRTDRWLDRQTDGQGETSIPPLYLRWAGSIIINDEINPRETRIIVQYCMMNNLQ